VKIEKLLFIGFPGSGKGTQAELLKKYGFAHISTGDIIRGALRRKDFLLTQYKESLEKGAFLPDEPLFNLLDQAVQKLEKNQSYVLDGAVRTKKQAQRALEIGLVDRVIFFNLSEKEAEKRLRNRRICPDCNGIYSVKQEKCLECDVPLITRKDDNCEAIKKRAEEYREKTEHVVYYLKERVEKYHEIDAFFSIEKIHEQVKKILNLN